jgi:hypothetical protein
MSPLVGYREWAVRSAAGREPTLASLFYATEWPPDGVLEARCFRPLAMHQLFSNQARTPTRRCECGIHAYARSDFTPWLGLGGIRVRGIVSGWGRYVRGTVGWRARYARILALLDHPEYPEPVMRLAARYDVPVLQSLEEAALETVPIPLAG